ncbi:MAG: hypothetical protein ACON47_03195 [Flavobacteriaceae bacterium]
MFSTGQLVFAFLFVIVFVSVIIRSYQKDKTEQPDYFKGSFRVLVAITIVVIVLFAIKIFIVS